MSVKHKLWLSAFRALIGWGCLLSCFAVFWAGYAGYHAIFKPSIAESNPQNGFDLSHITDSQMDFLVESEKQKIKLGVQDLEDLGAVPISRQELAERNAKSRREKVQEGLHLSLITALVAWFPLLTFIGMSKWVRWLKAES